MIKFLIIFTLRSFERDITKIFRRLQCDKQCQSWKSENFKGLNLSESNNEFLFFSQKCSPYAAHAYDAEDTLKPKAFPLLCPGYFRNFKEQCGHLSYIFTDRAIHSSSSRYCYPDIVRHNRLRNLGEIRRRANDGNHHSIII